jgi:hypothetical protein
LESAWKESKNLEVRILNEQVRYVIEHQRNTEPPG